MNSHAGNANTILRYLHPYQRKVVSLVPNATAASFRSHTACFMWAVMYPKPMRARGVDVMAAVPHAAAHANSETRSIRTRQRTRINRDTYQKESYAEAQNHQLWTGRRNSSICAHLVRWKTLPAYPFMEAVSHCAKIQ